MHTDITSYTYPRYSADGIEDTVQLNVHNETVEKKQSLHKDYVTRSNNNKDLAVTYQKQRLLACLESKHTNIDNNDEIYFNLDGSDDEERDILQQLDPLYQSQYDICKEQDELSKRFSQLKLTKSNEMQLDLFHLLKASNAPLVMFDRITKWVQRHEGTIISNGLIDLSNQ